MNSLLNTARRLLGLPFCAQHWTCNCSKCDQAFKARLLADSRAAAGSPIIARCYEVFASNAALALAVADDDLEQSGERLIQTVRPPRMPSKRAVNG